MAERVNKIARAFPKHVPFVTAIFCGVVFAAGNIVGQVRSASKSAVPKTWDDRIMAVLEVPLANPEGSRSRSPQSTTIGFLCGRSTNNIRCTLLDTSLLDIWIG